MSDYVTLIVLGPIALLAAIAANRAHDAAYMVHAVIVMLLGHAAGSCCRRGDSSSGCCAGWRSRPASTPAPRPEGHMDGPVRAGVIATAFWGVVVGTWIAFQLAFLALNLDWAQPHANFGRLRPLHTSAVVFAFGATP